MDVNGAEGCRASPNSFLLTAMRPGRGSNETNLGGRRAATVRQLPPLVRRWQIGGGRRGGDGVRAQHIFCGLASQLLLFIWWHQAQSGDLNEALLSCTSGRGSALMRSSRPASRFETGVRGGTKMKRYLGDHQGSDVGRPLDPTTFTKCYFMPEYNF